jgi:hypothetical protein
MHCNIINESKMTYKEFSKLDGERDSIISRRRQLQMTIRANQHYRQFVKGGPKYTEIKNKVDAAEKELLTLLVPPKPKHPIGYEVYIENEYQFYVANDHKEKVTKYVEKLLGYDNFTLKATPRFRDEDLLLEE